MIRRILKCQHLLRHITKIDTSHGCQILRVCPVVEQRRWCHIKTDSIKPVRVLDPQTALKYDTVLEEIKGLKSLQEMVDQLEQNMDQVNSHHLQEVFKKLKDIAVEQPSAIDSIKSETSFAILCQHTIKHIREFDRNQIVNLVAALCSLKVPLDCTLGLATMQMLRHFINDLSLQQTIYLDIILRNQPENPLVDAIKKALPLAMEIQLQYQLDPENTWLVLESLEMAIKYNLDRTIIEKLSAIVYHKAETLSKVKTAKAFLSFSRLKPFPPNLKKPLLEVLNRLQYFAMNLSEQETNDVLTALNGAEHLFDSKLLCKLSHKCCYESWELWRTSLLLSVFNSHKFLSSAVLNWTANILQSDPTPLWEDERVSLLTIFKAFSEANHKIDAKYFTSLVQKCTKKLNKLEVDSPEHLVKLAMHLAVLECLPHKLMEQVFQPEFISRALKSAAEKNLEPSLLQCFLSLEQSARLECHEEYQGPFLPPDLVKEAIRVRAQVMKPIDLILQQFLEVGLGGSQFMLTGLWTKLGHFIDHLVVMRKEDFPVDPTKESSLLAVKDAEGFAFVEDVSLPADAKVLAVLVARQEWFNKDPSSLRGWMSFQQRTLAKMGYNPVIIGPPSENADQIQDIDCCMEH